MMDIKIYQIDLDKDEQSVKFLSYDRLEKFQGTENINSSIYEMIYEGNVECSNLEEVYRMFNIDHPSDFYGHSLSVSDIVEVCESDSVAKGFYFCDSVGFKEVEFQPELCIVPEIDNEKPQKMSVLLVKAGQYPEMVEIDNTLEAKQELVGGYIEMICPFADSEVAVILNEEGKINGSQLNRALYADQENKDRVIDILAGDFFICSAPYDSDDFESLPPEKAEKYTDMFKYPELFFRSGNDIVALPYIPDKKSLDEMVKKAGKTVKTDNTSKEKSVKNREDFSK